MHDLSSTSIVRELQELYRMDVLGLACDELRDRWHIVRVPARVKLAIAFALVAESQGLARGQA